MSEAHSPNYCTPADSRRNRAALRAAAGIVGPVAGNDSATDVDTLTPQADLAITKDDGVTEALPGDVLTYTIVAANPGPSDALAVTVEDLFPPELIGCEWTCAPAGGAGHRRRSGERRVRRRVRERRHHVVE